MAQWELIDADGTGKVNYTTDEVAYIHIENSNNLLWTIIKKKTGDKKALLREEENSIWREVRGGKKNLYEFASFPKKLRILTLLFYHVNLA